MVNIVALTIYWLIGPNINDELSFLLIKAAVTD